MGAKNTIPGKSNAGPQNQWPKGYHLMSTVAVSGTATVNSEVFNISNLDNVGIQINFVGTMTGTLTVNCSIDNANFIALTFSPALSQPAGSNLSYLINLNQVPYPYVRLSYTNATGSGTLDVYLSAKDLN